MKIISPIVNQIKKLPPPKPSFIIFIISFIICILLYVDMGLINFYDLFDKLSKY